MLSLKLLDRSLCLIQVCDPNLSALHLEFVEETVAALRRVKAKAFMFRLGGCNVHVGNDVGVWKGVIGRHVIVT